MEPHAHHTPHPPLAPSDTCCFYLLPHQSPSNMHYYCNFECVGDEVLVESSPCASPPAMAARLSQPAQVGGGGAGASPIAETPDLIVIPATQNSIHLQQAIQQVSNTVVEVVNGDSSGHSSPNADHHFITVTGENGVGYHVQYVEPSDMYNQTHQTHMDPLRSYPVYAMGAAIGPVEGESGGDSGSWGGGAETYSYGVVVAADEARSVPDAPRAAASPAPAQRTPPATVTWLLDNYETAEGVSLPRSTLYAHYLRHCATHNLEPVNAASFGKLIRSVFLGLRTRRLGTRGNSKYHYYGIRAKATSTLSSADDGPDTEHEDKCVSNRHPQVQEPRDGGDTDSGPTNVHRHHLGVAAPPILQPLELTGSVPADITQTDLAAFKRQYADHCVIFLEAVASLELTAVERSRREFWRRSAEDDEKESVLPRRKLYKLAARKDVATWLRRADLELYQCAVELLLPDVLRPIPSALTQSIRNFAKTLESALGSATNGVPAASARAGAEAASALAAALRRYTSLNHLAQAARAVLHNSHQIHQMLTDLNRVDFRIVREQAAWACACGGRGGGAAQELEVDFKTTLGRGATLEQWAAWLERVVRGALAPHEHRPDYASRARRFLLDWSFYSSLVIRELTLRSAASFGSFHLIRLLYDEYVAYLVERRVAAHERTPPIAVMHPAQEDVEEEEEDEWEWEDAEGDVEGEGEGEGDGEIELDEDEPQEKKLKLN